jgi:choline dehydrogenase
MGSCAMGKVVDTNLRVKGLKNLRIVDASVLPIAIGAHTQASVYALAEHAAAIISSDK